jgi:hypothetical protein
MDGFVTLFAGPMAGIRALDHHDEALDVATHVNVLICSSKIQWPGVFQRRPGARPTRSRSGLRRLLSLTFLPGMCQVADAIADLAMGCESESHESAPRS